MMAGKTSGSVHFSKGGSSSLKSGVAVPLPLGVDGSWNVTLDVHPVGTRLGGTATVVVHDKSTLATKATGALPKQSTAAKVTLAGYGPSAGTRLNLRFTPTIGDTDRLPSLTGKVLGQKVRN